MAEFIDVLSPSALKDLEKANTEILTMVANIDKVGQKMKSISTPSGSDNAVKGLTEQYKQQEKVIQSLQIKLQKLTEAKKQSNVRTSEEIVNNRALAQSSDRLARANSSLLGAYDRLNAQHQISAKRLQDLVARGKSAIQTQKQYDNELKNAQREFSGLNTKVLAADRAVSKFNRNVGNYPDKAVSGLKDLIGAFGVLGGLALGASIVKDIFTTTKELQSLDLALKQVTETNEIFSESQQFLSRISEQYGIEIKGITKQFTQFYVSAKDKLSGKEIQGIFESVAKSAGFMGLSVESQDRAFMALNQMMSKGTVTAEELKGQLGEALPGAFGIMAKAIGVTEKELGDMMKQGQVMASDVLPKFAKALEQAYGIENKNRVETLSAAQTRLSNAWTNFIRELTEGKSVITAVFSSFVDWIGKAVEGLTLLMETQAKRDKRFTNDVENKAYKQTIAMYEKMTDSEKKLQAAYSREQVIKDINETIALNKVLISQAKDIEKRRDDISTGVGRQLLNTELKKANEAIQENNESIAFNKGLLRAYNEVLTEGTKKNEDYTSSKKKKTKAIKDNYDELARLYELEKLRIESQQRILDREFENDHLYQIQRIELAQNLSDERIKLANLTLKENLRLAKGKFIEEQIAYENYYKELETITKDEEEKILSLKKDTFDKFNEYRRTQGRLVEDETGIGDTRTLPTEELEKMIGLWEDYKKGVDDSEKSTKKLKETTNEWLQGFIDSFAGEAGFVTTFEILQDKVKGFGEDWRTTFVGIMEITQEAMNFIDKASEDRYQREINRLGRQKEIAVAFAGESASAREEIDRQYEARRLQIERRKAQQEKNMAIFNAIINTAQAVVAALPNIPMSVIVGAIGAAQIAMIAAQPLPQFATGTDNAPEGWAWTQEKGAEVITDKNGKVKTKGTDKGPQLTYLNKGDKVYTASESAMMFDNNFNNILAGNVILPSIIVEKDNSDITNEIKELGKIIKNRESLTVVRDVKGERIFAKKQGQTKQLMNNRLRAKGYDI